MIEENNWTTSKITHPVSPSVPENPTGNRDRQEAKPNEHDSTQAEVEFMEAMKAYKQRSGRMFPTWSEVLEVLRDLGYQKEGMFANTSTESTKSREDHAPSRR